MSEKRFISFGRNLQQIGHCIDLIDTLILVEICFLNEDIEEVDAIRGDMTILGRNW